VRARISGVAFAGVSSASASSRLSAEDRGPSSSAAARMPPPQQRGRFVRLRAREPLRPLKRGPGDLCALAVAGLCGPEDAEGFGERLGDGVAPARQAQLLERVCGRVVVLIPADALIIAASGQ
jgi:hypothetical protein